MRLIIGITGATGTIYGVRLLERLRESGVETHLVISRWGSRTLLHETPYTREQVEACYPEMKVMLAEKRRIDPEGKLSSPWYRHHRSLLGREACAVRWNR